MAKQRSIFMRFLWRWRGAIGHGSTAAPGGGGGGSHPTYFILGF